MPEIVLLIVVLIVFLVPALLQLRRQQRVLARRRQVQAGLEPGVLVVTAAGAHGKVVAVRDAEVDLEIAPGVVSTWDLAAVVRRVDRGGE